jgi:HSP20 family protein
MYTLSPSLSRSVRELNSLRQQFDRLFDAYQDAEPAETLYSLPVELLEAEDHYLLRALLPGAEPEQIDVQASRTKLTLSVKTVPPAQQEVSGEGEEAAARPTTRRVPLVQEIRYGTFRRMIEFGQPIENDQIQSEFKNGLLTLTLPKAEVDRMKSVRIAG